MTCLCNILVSGGESKRLVDRWRVLRKMEQVANLRKGVMDLVARCPGVRPVRIRPLSADEHPVLILMCRASRCASATLTVQGRPGDLVVGRYSAQPWPDSPLSGCDRVRMDTRRSQRPCADNFARARHRGRAECGVCRRACVFKNRRPSARFRWNLHGKAAFQGSAVCGQTAAELARGSGRADRIGLS
jgi:hypothetical protein